MIKIRNFESDAYIHRQKTRNKGRYSPIEKCEVCGKAVGEKYFSDERCDHIFHGLGLVLCVKCAEKIEKMSDEEGYKFLQDCRNKRKSIKEATLADYLSIINSIKVKKISKVKEYIKLYDGESGNSKHITVNMEANLPISYLESLQGVMGEKRDFRRTSHGIMFGNYSIENWIKFLNDIATNGIKNPIFITVDYNNYPEISEGNHRIQAAKQLKLETIPCEVRFFGKAEDNFKEKYDNFLSKKIKELK